jgi:hypothetical protein
MWWPENSDEDRLDERRAALLDLAAERRALKICGYRQPEEFPSSDRRYDFGAWPSPYTKGAGKLCPYYMLILQDRSSERQLLEQVGMMT